jgi:uncharacterized membrane protein YbjE (DUF340 family)
MFRKQVKALTFKIILAVVLGIFTGKFFAGDSVGIITNFMDIGLCALLFFVGIDIGKNKDVISQIKEIGIKAISTPILVAFGSIIGAVVCGLIFGYNVNESAAIGAGFGWYSLSAIIIAPYSSELSALSFMTNVSREILAIMSIPLVAKYIGFNEAVAPAGATAMDTTLPIISKATDGKTAIIAFVTGLILSILVPILVPIFIGL